VTQLQTISHNHISFECRCGHRKLLSVKELMEKLSPTSTVHEVVARAKCSHCKIRGVSDFRLLYVCGKQEES